MYQSSERRDGTYLLFKDPKNLEARYEVLVTPDSMTPVDWDFGPFHMVCSRRSDVILH